MRGGAKYFEWIGQLEFQSRISLSQRAERINWPRFARAAYSKGWLVESRRKDTEAFNQRLRSTK